MRKEVLFYNKKPAGGKISAGKLKFLGGSGAFFPKKTPDILLIHSAHAAAHTGSAGCRCRRFRLIGDDRLGGEDGRGD